MTDPVRVALKGRPYDVLVEAGLIGRAGEVLADLAGGRRVAVVADAAVAALHGARLMDAFARAGIRAEATTVPSGEESKSFQGLDALCDALLERRLERRDLIVAFGGGVVGDLAGFAAAIYKRGVDFVQIPTTLLSQVDSSVGGKTAIDTPRGKNLIGAFHQPRRVLADPEVLNTLPARELRCGYAEVLKYGLLGDAAFFAWLEAHGAQVLALEPGALGHAIRRSIAMKAEIVARDETETGERALLNLGHTFGHALEAETGFGGALRHGEGVGAGMALAYRFSAALGLCAPEAADRAGRAIRAAGLPTTLAEIRAEPFAADRLLDHMTQDKKAEGGALVLVLARALGEAFLAKGVDAAALRRFLIQEGAV